MIIENKNILILGSGKTGKSLYKFIKKRGGNPIICDEKENMSINREDYVCQFSPFMDLDLENVDFLLQSPGLSLDHEIFKKIKKLQIPFYGEVEFSSFFNKGKIIGVTGTNGKTTVVSALKHVLDFMEVKNSLCGNVGTPFIDVVEEDSLKVLELSSYQLESVNSFHSDVSIFLNLTVDHQERHKTMENYLNIKKQLILNSGLGDFVIYNNQDPYFAPLEKDLEVDIKKNILRENIKDSTFLKFNFKGDLSAGENKEEVLGTSIYYDELKESVILVEAGRELLLFKSSDLKIIGRHNIDNMMAVFLGLYSLGYPRESIVSGILSFSGVEHRLEYLGEFKGRKVYNDSKSTNPESAMSAILSFKEARSNVFLILGGSKKDVSYDLLGEMINLYDQIIPICQGVSGSEIRESIQKSRNKLKGDVLYFEEFDSSIDGAFLNSNEGDIILLSPACASFDKFLNFEERGRYFKDYVQRFK